MREERPFIEAILASPGDDAPRLIYADWLEEQSDSERAEFIKVQCELARLESLPENRHRDMVIWREAYEPLRRRSWELLDAHGAAWGSWVTLFWGNGLAEAAVDFGPSALAAHPVPWRRQ